MKEIQFFRTPCSKVIFVNKNSKQHKSTKLIFSSKISHPITTQCAIFDQILFCYWLLERVRMFFKTTPKKCFLSQTHKKSLFQLFDLFIVIFVIFLQKSFSTQMKVLFDLLIKLEYNQLKISQSVSDRFFINYLLYEQFIHYIYSNQLGVNNNIGKNN